MKPVFDFAIILSLSLLFTHVVADETTTTEQSSTDAETINAIGSSVQTEGKLTQEFSEFLGGEEQAASVVDGLRQGTSFSLNSEPTDSTSTTNVDSSSIEPPTGTMGYGNVKMTLRLAETKLAEMGITQPTSEQLSAVLLGGDIDGQQVDGILAMRADGMGWGEIAHQYDMKVGQLMGKGKPTSFVDTSTTQTTTANRNGYISPYSRNNNPGAFKHQSNGYIPSSKHGAGKGIITASGNTVHQNGYSKNNGKFKPVKTVKAHHVNKHGYIASGGMTSQSSVISNATATHHSPGKAKGHVNKK